MGDLEKFVPVYEVKASKVEITIGPKMRQTAPELHKVKCTEDLHRKRDLEMQEEKYIPTPQSRTRWFVC